MTVCSTMLGDSKMTATYEPGSGSSPQTICQHTDAGFPSPQNCEK